MVVYRNIICSWGIVLFLCCVWATATASATSLTEFVQHWDKAEVVSTRVERSSNSTATNTNATQPNIPGTSLENDSPVQNQGQKVVGSSGSGTNSIGKGNSDSMERPDSQPNP